MNKRKQLTPSPLRKSKSLSVSADSLMVNNDSALSAVINQRLLRQQQKYRQREGVFPVRFTGSLHDFTIITIESRARANRHSGGGGLNGSPPFFRSDMANEGRFPSMMYFTPCGVNIWVRRFHDYWLQLLDLAADYQQAALPVRIEEKALPAGQPAKYAPPFNQHDRNVMIDMLLAIFEKDVYLLPSQQQVQQASMDYVLRYIDEANALLAKSIRDRHDLL